MKAQLLSIALVGYVMTTSATEITRKSRSLLLDSVIKASDVKLATPKLSAPQQAAAKVNAEPEALAR